MSFWNYREGPASVWDVGVKLLVWGAVFGAVLYLGVVLLSK